MTITYDLYSSSDVGVIPKPYVTALGGETYKYESTGGGRKKKSSKAGKTRKSSKAGKNRKSSKARKSSKCYRLFF